MKKTLVLFGIIGLLPMSAMAYIYENQSSSMNFVGLQGFSQSTMQAVDWVKYRNQGVNGTYVRYFQPKKGSNWFARSFGRAYQNAKEYIDPIQDSGMFGDGHIEFSNTWMGNDTFYSSDYKINKQSENL